MALRIKSRKPKTTKRRLTLSSYLGNHIDYIVNEETLKLWTGLSIKDRCIHFHRKYPEIKMSASMLSQIYKNHGIKKRAIHYTKKFSE